jgi:hypothetical protein
MVIALAFLAMTILDAAWVGYNRATAQGRRMAASIWAVFLAALSGLNALAIVSDPWALCGTAGGALVGTLLGFKITDWVEGPSKPWCWTDRVRGSAVFIAQAPDVSRKLAIEAALVDVAAELQRARMKFAAFHSAHEGFAVALEEVDELRAHVWKKQKERNLDAMRAEAIQAAAMFAAFAAECCGEKTGRV